jgi:hypothetical protein
MPYFTQHKLISAHIFKAHWSNWVKFSMRDLRVMLFGICELVQIGAGKAVLFYGHKLN